MNKELLMNSVHQLSLSIRDKELSPVELTEEVLKQAEDTQEQINAYIDIYRKEALRSAKKAEQEIMSGNYKGMYHGIPMGVKDNIYFQDKVTTMGSKIHQYFKSDYDATVIKKLREAGVVFTGKLNMHEYAYGITNDNPTYGAVRNPWNLSKVPGGSSGGSGAAVAGGSSVASLGTDTAGSVRAPSSACGIVGLKPTYGRISNYGVFPHSWSLDHIGPMTKTVKDAASLLEIIAGFDKNDPTAIDVPVDNYVDKLTGDVKDLVIGVDEDFFFNGIDSDIERLVRKGIQKLVDQGARVQEVNIPSLKYAEWTFLITHLSEASTIRHSDMLTRPEDFGDDVRLLFELGELPSAVDYLQAQQVRRQLKLDYQEVLKKVDVFITPTLPIILNNIGEDWADLNGEKVNPMDAVIPFTSSMNLTGLPALTVPCGFKDGLPVGMQIIGSAFKEAQIMNVGCAFEQTEPLDRTQMNFMQDVVKE